MIDRARIILHSDNPAPLAERLREVMPQAEVRECDSYGAMNDLVPGFNPNIVYSVRFAGTPGFPRDVLLDHDGPRWIFVGGSGTDHLGVWDPERTTVTNAAGVAADMMAEYILGGFLYFSLGIPGLNNDKAARHWGARSVTPLKGKTLLIIGLGQTGRAVAARAQAFGMTVLGVRARQAPVANVDEVHRPNDLIAILPRADFITICTPLLPTTARMIGEAEIAAMKPGVVLADVSRGGVVDQSALLEALKSGQIAGAALDVFETEPLPKDSALWQMENLIISPHCSSVYDGWEMASFEMFVENLGRWMRGEPLRNVVDPARGY